MADTYELLYGYPAASEGGAGVAWDPRDEYLAYSVYRGDSPPPGWDYFALGLAKLDGSGALEQVGEPFECERPVYAGRSSTTRRTGPEPAGARRPRLRDHRPVS